MRQRFLSSNDAMFSEHELVEMLLFYTRPVINTNEIAHALVKNLKNINGIFDADMSELALISGVGEVSAAFLKFIGDMCVSYLNTADNSEVFSSHKQIQDYFLGYFGTANSALCNILILNLRLELLSSLCIPAEDILSGRFTTKRLAELLIRNNAQTIAVGISHNIPSPVPTDDDYRIVKIIAELTSHLGIKITDSIVCGGGKAFSMHRSGAFSL